MNGRHAHRPDDWCPLWIRLTLAAGLAIMVAFAFVLSTTIPAHAGTNWKQVNEDQQMIRYFGFKAHPCPHEDTIPKRGACYWDASVMGNGEGKSFVQFASGWKLWLKDWNRSNA